MVTRGARRSVIDDNEDITPDVVILQDEVQILRRRLQDAPKRVRTLEERLLEVKGQLARAMSQNEHLAATLREARRTSERLLTIVGPDSAPIKRMIQEARDLAAMADDKDAADKIVNDLQALRYAATH